MHFTVVTMQQSETPVVNPYPFSYTQRDTLRNYIKPCSALSPFDSDAAVIDQSVSPSHLPIILHPRATNKKANQSRTDNW